MPKTPKLPAITSTFALLDVQKGRGPLAKIVGDSYQIPVTMTGYIQNGAGGVGGDDGVSREFSVDVTSVVLGEPEYVPADKIGRPWALERDLKAGDTIQFDDGFDCLPGKRERKVKVNAAGELYFNCLHGQHLLDGQLGDHGEYIGVYKIA